MKNFKMLVLFTIEYICNVLSFGLSIILGVINIIEKIIKKIKSILDKLEGLCLSKRMIVSLTVKTNKENTANN